MEINIQEILIKHQKLVAEKHNIGTSLVMGHKKSYYDEASKNAIKEIITEVLKEAANSAKLDSETNKNAWNPADWYEEYKINKESITSTINKVKF